MPVISNTYGTDNELHPNVDNLISSTPKRISTIPINKRIYENIQPLEGTLFLQQIINHVKNQPLNESWAWIQDKDGCLTFINFDKELLSTRCFLKILSSLDMLV